MISQLASAVVERAADPREGCKLSLLTTQPGWFRALSANKKVQSRIQNSLHFLGTYKFAVIKGYRIPIANSHESISAEYTLWYMIRKIHKRYPEARLTLSSMEDDEALGAMFRL